MVGSIDYRTTCADISPAMINGFFVGWPQTPTAATLIAVMQQSYRRVWAIDDGRVVGYVNAISDGVLNAFIPWLEVHPHWQGRGIGTELLHRVVAQLEGMYAIDLCCDPALVPYYQARGFHTFAGAGLRRPAQLAGR